MSGTLLVVNLIVAIALMIALILIPKLNPAISLVIASIYMGVSCGLGFVTSIDTIALWFWQYDGQHRTAYRLWSDSGTAHERYRSC